MSTSTSLNDASKSACSQGDNTSSNKKVSTSCEQKVESCNNDGVEHNSSNIDAVSDSFGRVDISKDDDDKMAITDEKQFQDPPPKVDCPICMLPIPFANGSCGVNLVYMPCCGKLLCTGCSLAEDYQMDQGNIKPWCACCRVPLPKSNEERFQRYEKRMNMNDAEALYSLGCHHLEGTFGLPRNKNKAIDAISKNSFVK